MGDNLDQNTVKPNELIISYDKYHQLVLELAAKIDATGWRPNQVIGISRGGTLPAVVLSEYWQTPCAFISVMSYGPDRQRLDPGGVFFERRMINNRSGFGQNALLVDDLSDSGFTMQTSQDWLLQEMPHVFRRLRCAMIFFKNGSKFIPDFYAMEVKPDEKGQFPWILLPWEVGPGGKDDPSLRPPQT